MTPNLTLCVLVGLLFAIGVYLLLARSVSRSLMGLLVLGNAANILFLIAGGPAGRAPIVGPNDPADMSDPLPQAMVLTAVVISLGTISFMLALAHRSWQLERDDDVSDDPEDRRISSKAARDDMSGSDHVGEADETGESATAPAPRR